MPPEVNAPGSSPGSRCPRKWLYAAVVIDLFSRKLVGWSTTRHMKADRGCEATRRALQQRLDLVRQLPGTEEDSGGNFRGKLPGVTSGGIPGEFRGLVYHPDRGSQHASGDFQQLLDDHGIVCSMRPKGNGWDNAVSESFFGTLQTELDEPFATRSIAHDKLFDYIEVFYSRQRLHSTLNNMRPAAYEEKHQARMPLT